MESKLNIEPLVEDNSGHFDMQASRALRVAVQGMTSNRPGHALFFLIRKKRTLCGL